MKMFSLFNFSDKYISAVNQFKWFPNDFQKQQYYYNLK